MLNKNHSKSQMRIIPIRKRESFSFVLKVAKKARQNDNVIKKARQNGNLSKKQDFSTTLSNLHVNLISAQKCASGKATNFAARRQYAV